MVSRRVLGVLACCCAVLATAAPAHADVVDDAPAVAAQGTGDMRAFIRGSDGALWTRTWAGSSLTLNAGFGCIPQGGRVPVRLRIRQRTGRLKPRVRKVVYFIDGGKRRRVDHHAPWRTRIRVTYRRGSEHRIHARIHSAARGSGACSARRCPSASRCVGRA